MTRLAVSQVARTREVGTSGLGSRRASVLAKIGRLVCRGEGYGDTALRGCEVVQSSAVEGVAVGNVSGRSPDSKLSKSHQIKDRRRRRRWSARLAGTERERCRRAVA